MCDPISPSCYKPGSIAPEFIKEVEDKLSRRLGQQVSLVLGDGIIAMKADSVLPTGASTVVMMSAGPLLRRRRTSEWGDALEKKISRLRGRAQDVEDLFAEIQRSPGPEETGAIVLGHVGDYDDEFFEALTQVIAHEQAELRLRRARSFEMLRDYLRTVRRRADNDETGEMWRELVQGAARETDLFGGQG
jgi:hypothetical protein